MAKAEPQPTDKKYQRPDGTVDEDAWMKDYADFIMAGDSAAPSGASPDVAGGIAPDPKPAGAGPTAPARSAYWWESPSDDRTNDGGPDFANAVFDDSETKQFSSEAQAGMAAAKAAGDEAGYNGIKDAERERLARGAGFSESNPPPNPGVAPARTGSGSTGNSANFADIIDRLLMPGGDSPADRLGMPGEQGSDPLNLTAPVDETRWLDDILKNVKKATTARGTRAGRKY